LFDFCWVLLGNKYTHIVCVLVDFWVKNHCPKVAETAATLRQKQCSFLCSRNYFQGLFWCGCVRAVRVWFRTFIVRETKPKHKPKGLI
jgi:hypothetical protein